MPQVTGNARSTGNGSTWVADFEVDGFSYTFSAQCNKNTEEWKCDQAVLTYDNRRQQLASKHSYTDSVVGKKDLSIKLDNGVTIKGPLSATIAQMDSIDGTGNWTAGAGADGMPL
jgi:hypothetical protein